MVAFPVVTLCNLNSIKFSYMAKLLANASEGIDSVSSLDYLDVFGCDTLDLSELDINFRTLLRDGRHLEKDLVLDCKFMGQDCIFTPILTRIGYCYEFNGGRNHSPILFANGTGPRFGMQLTLNIEQDEYLQSFSNEAGAIMVIHPHGEPGEPSDAGITVPPGHGARIGLRKKIIKDASSSSTCKNSDSTKDFNFLFNEYKYSLSACLTDSYFTAVAEKCKCIDSSIAHPSSGEYATFPDCDVTHLCCNWDVYLNTERSGCTSACRYVAYQASVSYSAFPSKRAAEKLSHLLNISKEYIRENLMFVNIFFEDLNVQEVVTADAYGFIALISDIGGELSLFLGASVVTMLEFGVWILDELKDRFVGVNDKRILLWLRRKCTCSKRKEAPAEMKESVTEKKIKREDTIVAKTEM